MWVEGRRGEEEEGGVVGLTCTQATRERVKGWWEERMEGVHSALFPLSGLVLR